MIKSHNLRSQKGFTIVELLIVIVVIGILAALVLNSFAGVQAKARDTERATDVKALATQLEAYYNGDVGQGSYPLLAQFDTDAEATALLKGLDAGTLYAPGQTAISLQGTTSADKNKYGYVCTPDNATTPTKCTKFVLNYLKEQGNTSVVVNSLNQ